jgi:hypothetical protein
LLFSATWELQKGFEELFRNLRAFPLDGIINPDSSPIFKENGINPRNRALS